MSKKVDAALENFSNGYNCAQSVFLAFCKDYGIDRETACKLVNALGGGICKSGNMCGALSAGCLAMSAVQGKPDPSQPERQAKTYLLGHEMIDRFCEAFGATDCPSLLGYDLSDPEQMQAAVDANAFQTNCRKLIQKSVEMAEEYIAK